jgi:hypothetical protein
MDVADLFVALKISYQPVAGSIIVNASRECVLAGVLIVNRPTRSTQTMTQGSDSAILVGISHISCVHATSLSFDILDRWNINVQHLV